MVWSEGRASTKALTWRRAGLIQGTGRSLHSKGRGAQGEPGEVSGGRWGVGSLRRTGPCVCLSMLVLPPVYVRQRGMARRPHRSGLQNLTSRAGVARALLSLSFALCKMGIPITAFAQRLLWD